MRAERGERWLAVFVALYFLALGILLFTTPLSPSEAKLLFREEGTPTVRIAQWLHALFPGAPGIRLFPYLAALLSAWLYWKILRDCFEEESDRRFAFWLYLLLPGVIASSVLLNEASYAWLMVLLFLYAYRKGWRWLELFALLALLPSATAAFTLYGVLLVYGYRRRDYFLAITGGVLFLLSFFWGGYDISGRPAGHFLETLGVYAALFSPLYFVYYFYALYRISLEGPRTLYWYIAFGAMIVSILLSIRQQILIVDFSPYLLAGAMIPVAVYHRSLRVRMRRFQRGYRIAAGVVVASMILSALLIFLHRPIYRLLGNPRHFFAASLYRPYDYARELRKRGESCYDSSQLKRKERLLMRFYGIEPCLSSGRKD
ncbi:hypothetical protein [Nitratifractor sp.]